jgi:hypothetical protein
MVPCGSTASISSTQHRGRAIHEGDGTMRVYIDERGLAEQREALAEITYGRAGGSGCFPIFASTMCHLLDPQFVPVQIRVEGKRGSFSVPNVLEVQLAPHVDSVSGEEHEVQISLPKGFHLAGGKRGQDRGDENNDAESQFRSQRPECVLDDYRVPRSVNGSG